MAVNQWTDAMDVRLAELVADPLKSYTVIAMAMTQEFGVTITKGACIGRSHRQHLPARPSPIPRRKSSPEPVLRLNPARSPVPLPPHPPRRGGRVDIYQLNGCSCRYPFGEGPPFMYCGEPARGSSYCPTHYRLVYHTPKVRAGGHDGL